ncbi:MAG: hypothetical protein KGY61_03650 [Desulfobacterales bacterium]|nr:hypothetical protein [Desulfobacterales bacterium]
MWSVRVDLIKNRLYLTLGRIPNNKVKNVLDAIEGAVKKLAPGFSCVTRIVDARDINASDVAEIKKIQAWLLACGMRRVVRVGSEHGKQLLNLVGTDLGRISQEAGSLEEANFLLDEDTTQDRLVNA